MLSYQEVLGRMKQGPRAKAQGWGSPSFRYVQGAQASGKEANPPWPTSGQREQSPSPDAAFTMCSAHADFLPSKLLESPGNRLRPMVTPLVGVKGRCAHSCRPLRVSSAAWRRQTGFVAGAQYLWARQLLTQVLGAPSLS